MLQIESGVAMPQRRPKYPFSDMLPGDSIFFATKPQGDSARVSALRFVKVHQPQWRFQLRRVENGWRLWRLQ